MSRNVQALTLPTFKHKFYVSQERIPLFETTFKNAKGRGYFKDLTIEDIKYGLNTHILCISAFRMHESTLIFIFDMCSGYELNTPISEQKKSSQLS